MALLELGKGETDAPAHRFATGILGGQVLSRCNAFGGKGGDGKLQKKNIHNGFIKCLHYCHLWP